MGFGLGGYGLGDLVGYQSVRGGVVKARIVGFDCHWAFSDDWWAILEVTGGGVPGYPRGYRFRVRTSSANLFGRRRAPVKG